jgi:hypothetical protein
MDACPGRLNEISLFIKKTGKFYGQCSELCGVNHGFMPIEVIVVEEEDFLIYSNTSYFVDNVPELPSYDEYVAPYIKKADLSIAKLKYEAHLRNTDRAYLKKKKEKSIEKINKMLARALIPPYKAVAPDYDKIRAVTDIMLKTGFVMTSVTITMGICACVFDTSFFF